MIRRLRNIFLGLFITIPFIGISQDDNRVLDKTSDRKEVIEAFEVRPIGNAGTWFLDNNWYNADIYFRSGLIVKGFPVRFDLEFNLLEVRIDGIIRVLPIGKLEKYDLYDIENGEIITYGSGRNYRNEYGTPISGLCKIYEHNNLAAITNYLYSIKDPDYIKEFDVGNKEKKLFITEEQYVCIDKIAYPLTMKKKELIKIIGSESEKALAYINEEKLNPKREKDLKQLIDYMGSDIK